MKILLYGWYNADNLGDDFMLYTTYKYLESKNNEVYILNKGNSVNYFNQKDIYKKDEISYKKYSNNKFINKFVKLFKYYLNNKAYKDFDMIIFIGGGYVNSVFSTRELLNIYALAKKFKKNNKKVFFTGQTVGPFEDSSFIEKLAKKIYKLADGISTREKASNTILNEYGIQNKLVGDDAFLLEKGNLSVSSHNNEMNKKYIVVNVKYFDNYDSIQKKYFEIIKEISKKMDVGVVCVPFRSDMNSKEYKINNELQIELNKNGMYSKLIIPKSIDELYTIYKNSEFTIGTAYHSIVLSLLFNKNAYSVYVGKYYKRKIEGILGMYDLAETNSLNLKSDINTKEYINYIVNNNSQNEKIENRTESISIEVKKFWDELLN